MFIRLETTSGVPITRQVMDQIRVHIASGALQPEDRLPSVRILARQLAVNQNTILRVYERLTMEGLLERRQGNGTFVTSKLSKQQIREQAKQLCQQIENIAARAAELGVEPEELHKSIDRALERQSKGNPNE